MLNFLVNHYVTDMKKFEVVNSNLVNFTLHSYEKYTSNTEENQTFVGTGHTLAEIM